MAHSGGTPESDIEALRADNRRLRAELATVHALLEKKDAQLHRILNVVGAAWLAPVGRFVYVALVPALDALRRRGRGGGGGGGSEPEYARWVGLCERVYHDPARTARRIGSFPSRPLVSVLLPVLAEPSDEFRRTIASIRAQYYADWELCVEADSGAVSRAALDEYAASDARVRPGGGEYGGNTAAALSGAFARARGEFVLYFGPDGDLSPDAILEFVGAALESGADAAYSDEDVRDAGGRRTRPQFKPGWSPDLLLSTKYVGRPAFLRRDLVARVGAFRPEFDGGHEYDLWLRVAESVRVVVGLPRVLFHARGESAADAAIELRAVAEAIDRRAIDAAVEPGIAPGSFRVRRRVDPEPQVSIIIPTRDRVDLLARIVDGIEARTDYRNVEVVIVDNGSSDRATLEYLAASRHTVIRDDGPFNYSRLNNLAVSQSRGALVLLLNNDTDPLDPGWLRAMVEHAQRPDVGAVGAKLLYPSGRLQHGGVVLGITGVSGHIHKHLDPGSSGYGNVVDLIRDVSAVTAACLLLRRSVFDEVGGLNETDLAVAYNDVDFCLRIRERGYSIVYTPYALLTHFESESRGRGVNTRESDFVVARWEETLFRDPFYSPNLTRVHEDYSPDYSKPDGLRQGVGRQETPGLRIDLVHGRPIAVRFWSTHDKLAGICLKVDERDVHAEGVVRLTLKRSDGAGTGGVIADILVSVSRTGQDGSLFFLFDAPVAEARDAFVFEVEAIGTKAAIRLRAHTLNEPAYRLMHK